MVMRSGVVPPLDTHDRLLQGRPKLCIIRKEVMDLVYKAMQIAYL